ncbi:MAG: ATP-binding protein [Planctomycetes bacterium]|nr:ATP-binding protein [Planctomycetota bacterium]
MIPQRKLKMTFAGRFIDLLGHQMYGGPVPSVAELIANSWDADSKKVEITIPEASPQENPDAQIIIKDYGEGMTFDEINDFYLHIGYERRKNRGERTTGNRLVMGRKGIGKLAGFGIAEDMVLTSVKNGHLIEFNLNYTTLKSKAEISGFEFLPDKDEKSNEPNGVTVILKNLKFNNRINVESFRKSMSRRFALNTIEMQVHINGQSLTKETLDFEYLTSTNGEQWTEEEVAGFGKVKYWFGFLKETIKDKELRGISVFARDRVAQFTPFHFNLSGGINGQVGLEYLTGQVKAEILDEDIDYIATPRQTVNWQFGNAPILEKWGQDKIKELCRDWKKRSDQRKLDKFKHDYSEFAPIISGLPRQEQSDLTTALEKIAGIERINEDDFRIIARSMIAGVERESVKKIIRRINATDENALPDLFDAIKEWDIISAVSTAEVVAGKIEIIKQFRNHIEERLPEKAPTGTLDMQTFIKTHPWLLGPQYEQLKPADFYHEHGIDKWIEEITEEIDKKELPFKKEERENRRFDLLCIKNDWLIVILELMKPGLPIDYDHIMRLNRYITRIQDAIKSKGTLPEFQNKTVYGFLIADKPQADTSLGETITALRHLLDVITWKGLLELVEARYREFLELLKMQAPEDPRMKGYINPQ